MTKSNVVSFTTQGVPAVSECDQNTFGGVLITPPNVEPDTSTDLDVSISGEVSGWLTQRDRQIDLLHQRCCGFKQSNTPGSSILLYLNS